MSSGSRNKHRVRGTVDERYDAIILGAGVGGLTSAALLARQGKKVLVLDQHYVPGGNATLFRRKDWEFDVGLHYIGECEEGGTIPRILDACGVDGVVFRPMDDELEQCSFPGFEFSIPKDRDEFRRRLLLRFPNEARGIKTYFRFLEQCERVVLADQRGSLLARGLSIATSPLLIRWANAPLAAVLNACTQSQELRAILTAQNGTYAVAPSRVSAVLHAGLVNHYFRSGGYYPEGGGQELSYKLAEAVERHGGHIRLRAPVSRVVVRGGVVRGVTFHNKHLGERTVHADVVISNADLLKTVNDLVGPEHFKPKWVERINRYEMALPLFMVCVGLDIDPDELPYGNANRWLFDRLDFDTDYARMCAGEMPEAPFIYVATVSKKDPGNKALAPQGHTNLEVMTMVPNDLHFWGVTEASLRDGSYSKEPAYLARKQEVEDALLAQLERVIPGASAHLVYKESCSPMTHTRYVRSTLGSAYGFASIPSQFLGARPGAKSTVEGLYFCGTNCRAGHGIMGAMTSGVQAVDAWLGGGLQRDVFRGTLRAKAAPRQDAPQGLAGATT